MLVIKPFDSIEPLPAAVSSIDENESSPRKSSIHLALDLWSLGLSKNRSH